MEHELIRLEHVGKFYSKKFKALDDLNISLTGGKIVGLLGPNGSGKTTLLKILSGMIAEFEGKVFIDGREIGIESKADVAYLPDVDFFPRGWNAEYAIKYYADFFADFDIGKARYLLDKLKIDTKKAFGKLSKGNREKVQLIFTLSRKAKIYLFDEPIAGVDPAAREFVFRLIIENCVPDSLILISTHLINDAERIMDDFIFLKEGKIVRYGNAKRVVEETGSTIDELFRRDFACF